MGQKRKGKWSIGSIGYTLVLCDYAGLKLISERPSHLKKFLFEFWLHAHLHYS